MAAIDKLTVLSTDGAGELPRQVTNNIVQTLELLKTSTGVDLQGLVEKYSGAAIAGASAKDEDPKEPREPREPAGPGDKA